MSSRRQQPYDLLVVGGGTAGLVASAGVAGLGARVALVERDRLGGECLWTGCVPSKAMIGSARIAHALETAPAFGLSSVSGAPANGGVLASARDVRDRIQPHDDPDRFRALGVDVFEGVTARFADDHQVRAGDRTLTARRILVATGSRPAIPTLEGLETAGFFTHETAFERDALPESVLVLGAGPVGVEFAQAYARLGVAVTLIELADRVLPSEDAEMSAHLGAVLEGEGVRLRLGCRVVAARRRDGLRELLLANVREPRDTDVAGDDGAGGWADAERAHEILVAAGRSPNVDGLDLDSAGIVTGPDGITVDRRLRTSRRHIFAAGDVTGGFRFTHVADHEARAVIRNAMFPFPTRVDYSVVPWAIFTEPTLARVGLTETQARDRHGDGVRVYRYETASLDRVLTDRETGGPVKLVADRRGRIVGGHILAPGAGTMIMEVALAMRHGLKVSDLSQLVHPYPTMSEGVRRAADTFYRSKLTDRTRRWLDRYLRISRTFG